MLYTLQDLKKKFDARLVLDLPYLALEEGQIYALLGPNGSGKTTLLHILAFLLPPSSGAVYFNDNPVFYFSAKLNTLRRKVVLVHQHPILFTCSVFKNVEYGLKVRKVPQKKRIALVQECLELVGLQDFASARAHRLSGGETQRVAIARALACNPEVLLFDEPTASVDAEHQANISAIIKDIHAQKKISVILSTHNHLQAAALTQKKIFLFQGRMGFSLAENILSGYTVQTDQGRVMCRINPGLEIQVNAAAGKKIKLGLDPGKMQLIPCSQLHKSTDTCFKGRLIQLSEQENYIRAIVDAGTPLHLFLPTPKYQEHPFTIGESVGVSVPFSAVEILDIF